LGFSLALRVEGLVRVILGFRVIEDDNHFSVFPANFFLVQSFIPSTFHLQLKMIDIWKHTQIQGLGIRPLLFLGIRPLLKFRVKGLKL